MGESRRRIVCSDKDIDVWKAARRSYLTASDIFTFAEMGGKYWPGTREEILVDKCFGIPREFSEESWRKITHGNFDEDNILKKFCHFAQIRGFPSHYFVTNDRWPWLGATLDSLISPPRDVKSVIPGCFTDNAHVQAIRDQLVFQGRTGIGEVKNTENKANSRYAWFGRLAKNGYFHEGRGPEYYHPQIQTQMHVAEYDWCVLVGQIGSHNMQVHFFERDPDFAEFLDDINETFRVERLNFVREYGTATNYREATRQEGDDEEETDEEGDVFDNIFAA